MAAGSFIAGPYSATFDGTDLGATEEGFMIEDSIMADDVMIDEFGQSVVDAAYIGVNIDVSMKLAEWNINGRDKILGFLHNVIGKVEAVGTMLVAGNKARSLVLTPKLAGPGQFTYTFPLAAPVNSRSWNLNSRLRTVSLNMKIFVNPQTGVYMVRN